MLFLIFTCFLQSRSQLFTGNCPTAPLKEALKIARKIKPADASIDTKEAINTYLQKKWLRKTNTECNESTSPSMTLSQIREFRNTFCKLQMISAQKSKMTRPLAVVILGARYSTMQDRIACARTFVESLKQKPHVILLTGDRYLEKIRSDDVPPLDQGAPKTCITEEDAGKFLAAANQDLSIDVVNGSKQPGAKRATTNDNARTLQDWLGKQVINKGEIVLVSSQPYSQYQLAIFLRYFVGMHYCFSVISAPLKEPFDGIKVANCMDTLARWVYTETIPHEGKRI